MTPDSWTDLQIVNATEVALFSGTGGEGHFGAYQMAEWFGHPSAPVPVVPARAAKSYRLQFKKGVGDQDDSADMQLNIGPSNQRASNVAWLQGRTNDRSVHRLDVQIQRRPAMSYGPFAVAINDKGVWPARDPMALRWYCGEVTVPMGSPNAQQCLAIVDLQALFGTEAAAIIAENIGKAPLSRTDATNLWLAVERFVDF
jgi:hypothetical protein